MRATGFNHVSLVAHDLERSVRFYTEIFGMEKIATYTFAFPVQYLRLGDLQLHLFERDAPAPAYHHIGIDVDDYEEAYRRARELEILEKESFFSDMYELPDGSVQMYVRDPAGNLVELDWPDVSTLDRTVITTISRVADERPQSGEAASATLYHAAGKALR